MVYDTMQCNLNRINCWCTYIRSRIASWSNDDTSRIYKQENSKQVREGKKSPAFWDQGLDYWSGLLEFKYRRAVSNIDSAARRSCTTCGDTLGGRRSASVRTPAGGCCRSRSSSASPELLAVGQARRKVSSTRDFLPFNIHRIYRQVVIRFILFDKIAFFLEISCCTKQGATREFDVTICQPSNYHHMCPMCDHPKNSLFS